MLESSLIVHILQLLTIMSIKVEISDLYSTSLVTEVQLFGVEAGNGTTLTRPPDWSKIKTNPVSSTTRHMNLATGRQHVLCKYYEDVISTCALFVTSPH